MVSICPSQRTQIFLTARDGTPGIAPDTMEASSSAMPRAVSEEELWRSHSEEGVDLHLGIK